jgi:hypothetical protein
MKIGTKLFHYYKLTSLLLSALYSDDYRISYF